jgi:hypothetical protein
MRKCRSPYSLCYECAGATVDTTDSLRCFAAGWTILSSGKPLVDCYVLRDRGREKRWGKMHTQPARKPSHAEAVPEQGAEHRGKLPAMCMVTIFFLVLGVGITSILSQEDDLDTSSRERKVKATYLYHFGRYVQWPAEAFASAKSPLVIGLVEDDRIIAELQQLTRTKTVQDRRIEIRKFSLSSDFTPCHILFLPETVPPEIQGRAIQLVSRKPVLLVGEGDSFLSQGGAIRFFVEDYKIRLQISKKGVERHGLTIRAPLLQVAQVVD